MKLLFRKTVVKTWSYTYEVPEGNWEIDFIQGDVCILRDGNNIFSFSPLEDFIGDVIEIDCDAFDWKRMGSVRD